MKLLVDTSSKDLYVAIFWQNRLYKKIHIKDITKKVDPLVNNFQALLAEDISLIDNIKEYYINIGPGSFTGARSALIYFKTFASVLNKRVFVSNTFEIINAYNNECNLYLNATKSNSFKWNCNDKNIEVIEKSLHEIDIDYQQVEQNIEKVFSKFSPIELNSIIDPLYGKKPQVGAKK
ncbi:hypothetical protein [Mycoplasma phocimorsus]|uniref:Gcp-like domain-containing protein n=1 Tax=Mycoplasma phocimorsus TaxID=3045839 RepID=A0AAJ1PSG3_9MOLU|nr:hypothetical protein [Mycoplasma phocimorsus]MDJ1645716.1 hypothetical protein [Mycoplasma phocimorsus]MDJ1646233.1 hypothetical protein [Mycoplasma phocimorsus]MDJ1646835.1 hypothetical protein [Mycoplasma phocimorsus]MDJ1647802.1 hypothetical protein [Mycoplasma phocimorsus]MDJ1648497.1 hypothetical protein [Mycoplasma phocimorsus]